MDVAPVGQDTQLTIQTFFPQSCKLDLLRAALSPCGSHEQNSDLPMICFAVIIFSPPGPDQLGTQHFFGVLSGPTLSRVWWVPGVRV